MVGRVVDRMPHDSGPRESVIRRQVRIVGNRDVEAHRARRSTDRRTAGGSLKKVRACGNRSNAIKFGEAGTFERLPPPPAYNWYTSSFWQVQVPYTRLQFQRFHVVHWAYKYVFIPVSSLYLPYISKCYSPATVFFNAGLSLLSIPSLTYVLHPLNFSMGSISSRFLPISFHSQTTTSSHLIPAHSFVTFSHTVLSAIAGNLFLACSLLYVGISTSSRPVRGGGQ